MVIAFAIVTGSGVARASATCAEKLPFVTEVAVETKGVQVRTDYTLSELAGMAANAKQQPPHPVLGAYAEMVGFKASVSVIRTGRCVSRKVAIRIIVKGRVIEIARDIGQNSCQFSVALHHYQHHAQANSAALSRSVAGLQVALQTKLIENDAGLSSQSPSEDARRFVDDWLGAFHDTLPAIGAAADTHDEVRSLEDACRA